MRQCIVRRERLTDRDEVRVVHASAFDRGEGEPVETRLLDELRECDGWIPELSWVAEIGGRAVGHSVSTRGHVEDVGCLGLGPIGVVPEAQRMGVGSALIHATIGAADAMSEPLIALLGDPAYYGRFGFVPSTEHGISPPEASWGPYFQVLPLSTWNEGITGTFRYATPFDKIG